MSDWKEAREEIVGLLKYGTATDQPFTPVGKKALSTALQALDIVDKVEAEMPEKRKINELDRDQAFIDVGFNSALYDYLPLLAQKEKRIGELQDLCEQEKGERLRLEELLTKLKG